MATPIVIVSAVRGTGGNGVLGGPAQKTWFDFYYGALQAQPSIRQTWLLRWDAINNSDYDASLATRAAAGDAFGVWCEICSNHCTAASVTYNSGGTDALAVNRSYPTGYVQADRVKLIDTLYSTFHTKYGYYPTCYGGWVLDSYCIQYVKATYGTTVFWTVREQGVGLSDDFAVWGGPQNCLYEPDANYQFIPTDGTNRSGVCLFRDYQDELLNPGVAAGKVWSDEPQTMSFTPGTPTIAAYWQPLITGQCGVQTQPQLITWMTETGWDVATQGGYITDAFALLAGTLAPLITYRTPGQMAARFLAQSTAYRDLAKVTYQNFDAGLGTTSQCVEIVTPHYKARWRFKTGTSGYLGLTELLYYPANPVEPYYTTPVSGQDSAYLLPSVFDGVYATTTSGPSYGPDLPSRDAEKICVNRFDSVNGTVSDFKAAADSTFTQENLVSIAAPNNSWAPMVVTRGDGWIETVTIRPRGLLWQVAGTAPAQDVTLTWNGGFFPASDLTLYSINGATPVNQPASGSFASNTYVGAGWQAWVWTNLALILFDYAHVNCTPQSTLVTGGTSSYGTLRTGGGAFSQTVAMVPCTTATWPTVLAALQANANSYLEPAYGGLTMITTFTYDTGAFVLQGGSPAVSWSADTIKARIVDAAVTPLQTDTNLTGYTAIGTDGTLASKTITNDTTNHRTYYSAANPTVTSPAAAQTYGSVVIYKDGADDAHRLPLFCLALTPAVTDGTDLLLAVAATGLGATQQ